MTEPTPTEPLVSDESATASSGSPDPLDAVANIRANERPLEWVSAARRLQLDPATAARVGLRVSPKSIRQLIEVQVRAQARANGRPFDEAMLRTPAFTSWVAKAEAAAATAGNLITDMQYADLLLNRELRVGDKARYVGPTRAEDQMGKDGASVIRPNGQRGTIIRAAHRSDGRLEVTFQPELAPGVRDAALRDELDVPLVKLTVAGDGCSCLERVPG